MDKALGKDKIALNPASISTSLSGKSFLGKQITKDFWSFIDNSVKESKFSWKENVEEQINLIQQQTQEFSKALTTNNGKQIDLLG
jgi:hypothetical protein